MSDGNITKEEFVRIVNDYLSDSVAESDSTLGPNTAPRQSEVQSWSKIVNDYIDDNIDEFDSMLVSNTTPWQSDDVRWKKLVGFAKTWFLQRLAKNHSYYFKYLGDDHKDAVDHLTFTFLQALDRLRKNKLKNPHLFYEYNYIVRATQNKLRNEIRKTKFFYAISLDELKEKTGEEPDTEQDKAGDSGSVGIGSEIGLFGTKDDLDEQRYWRRIRLISTFISSIADLSRDGNSSSKLLYNRVFLARFIIEAIKSQVDIEALLNADYLMSKERDITTHMERAFVSFCMLVKEQAYDSFIDIFNNDLGLYHDMTVETEELRDYACYSLDRNVEIPIEDRVISSYLYSIGIKGDDGVSAIAINTVSGRYTKMCKTFGITIDRRTIKQETEKTDGLYQCVFELWQDATFRNVDEPLAVEYIEAATEVTKNPNTVFVGRKKDAIVRELDRITPECFVSQWNWLNDNQPESYPEARSKYLDSSAFSGVESTDFAVRLHDDS